MNIGDKVRMVRAKEQGIVTRFLPGNQVEIEIEDGFRIPVLRSEIVVVSAMEAKRFQAEPGLEPQKPARPEIIANSGIYLAFIPQNDRNGAREVDVYLVNNTDWELPFTIGEERENRYLGLHSDVLKARSFHKLVQQYSLATLENWPTFLLQGLWHRRGASALREPLIKRLKCRTQTFQDHTGTIPVLNQTGTVFQLDLEETAQKEPPKEKKTGEKPIDVAALRDSLLGLTDKKEPATLVRPSSIIDLHIGKLLPNGFGSRTNVELLEVQLQAFEKNLENAIASGMDHITFIHGVGNGVLRNELHRRLGSYPGVAYFEDAQKEKFGYGATKVKIK
ncbi:Smr/MutS family protein [Larkinella terrae]|uniref:DNA mismatch repair protein MutS n=1 Tax=Larkinella terrae TaxID=2025311 RepID=A0A7K0EM91_9BACT|nr:Smr/MutS family protein [Larkinella terrae]MRS62957.1 DNA mismatch repair protein MutS [Larkinella terrae]